MPIKLSDQMSLAVDVAIFLKKKSGMQEEASIDRKLVDLLLAIDDTQSVAKACERLNYSTRYAQRMMKHFFDGSGIVLLEHHGSQGTKLTEEARQCIALYVALLGCIEQIARTNRFPRALPPLSQYPTQLDWNHRDL